MMPEQPGTEATGADERRANSCVADGSSGSEKSLNGSGARRLGEGEQRRMVDITRDKPIKVTVRVVVPVRDHPKFNFVGKLLGPKGNSLKRLQEDTMTKMAILGKGSMRDKHKEEELRSSGDPKFSHLSDDLHVEITAFAPPAEAHARIAYALAEVRRFLVPDYNDEIRQEQMWEMQLLNTQRGRGCGGAEALQGAAGGAGGGGAALQGAAGADCGAGTASPCSNGSLTPPTPLVAASPPPPAQHPALRGLEARAQAAAAGGAGSTQLVCRKRPLLPGGGTRLAMSPTKRTVLSILARARAAQAKDLPDYHPVANGCGLFRELFLPLPAAEMLKRRQKGDSGSLVQCPVDRTRKALIN
ncbi:KH domain-containing, RNA-binding, signal transduction-associated protein 2 [Bacillus rossius redtenbacheri]|uniref:KH domain-containing, RNA-binding, signal transduction-associated protein 2 n=1 Tax=Bacillus rossius redtenbacheri TaxID=93214 RepID=UPI002FDE3D4E